MKKLLKWTAIILACLLIAGFVAFLYFIPPFTTVDPEAFIQPEAQAPPSLENIADPAERLIAERGKYIVTYTGCAGCHTAGGDQGPKFDTEYMAGGLKFSLQSYGTSISRNLTPDKETGLGERTDEQIERVLRSGVFKDGRVFFPLIMPWADFSNMTEEDRRAVVVYLRHLKPVRHKIPDWTRESTAKNETFYGMDYAIHEGQ